MIEYSHVLSYKKKHQDEFAIIILKRLKKYYEISKNIIDNWDKLFTFNCWKTLISKLNMRQKTTNFDEQSRSLEQHIQHYANIFKHKWIKYLSIVKYQLKLTKSNKKANSTMMKQMNIIRLFTKLSKNHQAK